MVCTLSGFSITVSVYYDGFSIMAVYRNPYGEVVDRVFNATLEQINRRLEELDGVN